MNITWLLTFSKKLAESLPLNVWSKDFNKIKVYPMYKTTSHLNIQKRYIFTNTSGVKLENTFN